MRFPSKITTVSNSILALFPVILSILKLKPDLKVNEVCTEVLKLKHIASLEDIIQAIDCLYALGEIEFDSNEGRLIYANRDKM